MLTSVRDCALACGIAGLAALLTGCPGNDKSADNGTAPASAAHPAPAPTKAAQPPATPTATPPAQPAQAAVAPPAVEDNPRPTGDTWVYIDTLTHHIGEKLQVSYHLPAANGGKAWVGLVPDATAAQDAASNEAAAVASSPTVDAATAALNVAVPQVGRFKLRLFESHDLAAKLLAESKVLTITQWPLGDLAKQIPPYVTINPVGNKGEVEIQETFPVIAYFELPLGYDIKGWVGVVPLTTKSPLEIDNDAAQVSVMYLNGKTKDQFTWKADKLGTFVFRVFPSDAPGCDYVAQSEPFTIVPKKP